MQTLYMIGIEIVASLAFGMFLICLGISLIEAFQTLVKQFIQLN